MKNAITILCTFLMAGIVYSQSPSFQWAKSIGGVAWDEGHGIATDGSGNVYIAGQFFGTADFDPGPGTHSLTSAGDYEGFVCKLNASGDFVWAATLGGTSADVANYVTVDASGNVLVAGAFQGTADFDPGPSVYTLSVQGPSDNFICKLSKDGDFIWAKQFVALYIEGITTDAAGNVYTTGGFYFTADADPGAGSFILTAAGQDDIFISKLDASGNFAWARAMGNTGGDRGRSIDADDGGNVYTIGYYESMVDFDPGAGTSNLTSAGGWDIYVQKLNASGNLVWAKSIGGVGWDEGRSISVDRSSGTYINIAGGFEQTCDFDPGAGATSLTSAGSYDSFVCRLDGSGNLTWVKALGGTGYDMAYCVSSRDANRVYSVGTFTGAADFDPGTPTYTLSGSETFLSALDGQGAFCFAAPLAGNIFNGRSFAADNSGNLWTTGSFGNTIDFDPGTGIFNLTAVSAQDVFIIKLTGSTVGVEEQSPMRDVGSFYPNPANGNFSVLLNSNGDANLKIYTLTGEVVFSSTLHEKRTCIDLSSYPNGVYFAELLQAGTITTRKLIKGQ